jgi:hypothetical protein
MNKKCLIREKISADLKAGVTKSGDVIYDAAKNDKSGGLWNIVRPPNAKQLPETSPKLPGSTVPQHFLGAASYRGVADELKMC